MHSCLLHMLTAIWLQLLQTKTLITSVEKCLSKSMGFFMLIHLNDVIQLFKAQCIIAIMEWHLDTYRWVYCYFEDIPCEVTSFFLKLPTCMHNVVLAVHLRYMTCEHWSWIAKTSTTCNFRNMVVPTTKKYWHGCGKILA